ncbi:MAG: DNA replication protein [Proteobacteria bacterium]|nr:DNA replication protein [Pseudomonadota bacterium]
MTSPLQIALPLSPRPAFEREDFLVAPSNREAVAWVERWPDWPGRTLAIHGPPASGKSHLAHVWRALSGASICTAAGLAERTPDAFFGGASRWVVEEAERVGDERRLLHLLNLVREVGGSLLLLSLMPPAQWPVALPDLASRLKALPAVGLGPPDDALLAALLVKQFADRQLQVQEEVIPYCLARMERSFAAARRLVQALDEASLAARRPVTVPLARRLLSALEERSDEPPPSGDHRACGG